MANGDDNGYPRVLDRAGCLYGQRLEERMDKVEQLHDELKGKIDRMTWALVSAAVGLGTAAVMLALNLWVR